MESHSRAQATSESSGTSIPVAQYLRASSEHQKYSTANQSLINEAYAATHGMVIVRSYTDRGRSGLDFERRDAWKQLIEDAEKGKAEFEAILVYDVSRWGRFQDTDESAHYEFICKRAGIKVHYCAEQFENDGSPLATIIKGIKRAMAAEYSRELSAKVFHGQCRLIKLGYSQGASAPFGMRRLLSDQNGAPKGLLSRRESKSIKTDRVVVVPGPPEELEVVRWIFETFAQRKMREREIANTLNQRGIRNVVGRLWTYGCVRRVLGNEHYVGNNVWNRTSGKLKSKRRNNPPDQWVRADGACDPIVSRELFEMAGKVMREGLHRRSQEEKLEPLRRLLREHGYLSAKLINASAGVPSTGAYHRWFGGLYRAYELAGFILDQRCARFHRDRHRATRCQSNERLLEGLRQLLIHRGFLNQGIIDETTDLPCSGTYQKRFGSITRAYELIGYNYRSVRRRRQGRASGVACKLANADLLASLQQLLRKHGYLTGWVIEESPEVPSVSTYRYRFGRLERAYELIGYKIGRNTPRGRREDRQRISDDDLLQALKRLWQRNGHLTQKIVDASDDVPAANTYMRRFGSLARAYALIGFTPRHERRKKWEWPG
jgi:DNA invertase Pin-like site-specific DNA recombinase